ncbi:hypothetical protein QJS10_CPA01g01489 [Acorus calamus]|uniref:Uncharacterized protein n=1 Tax=Acorus calamus TaxID=4465 RepID=A0AAV9FLI5_ACOCL|nr:hypothetical protein QJS10_CPA01g01489 [Acorus calamus]
MALPSTTLIFSSHMPSPLLPISNIMRGTSTSDTPSGQTLQPSLPPPSPLTPPPPPTAATRALASPVTNTQ